MQRRIFIGISLPDDIKKRLSLRIEKWRDLPIKWSDSDNFHVTLSFLGHIDDESLVDICAGIQRASKEFEGFEINLEEIELGPSKESPKVIWLSGGANEELRKLKIEIEKYLDMFVAEKKEFRPHVTLGKISKHKWEALSEKPKIEERFRISIPVLSVDIFESKVENGKTKFEVLEACELK